VDVGGGQHLGQALPGLQVDEDHVRQVSRLLLEGQLGRARAVDDEDDILPTGQATGRLEHEADGLGVTEVAGVHHHPPLAQAELGPVVVVAVARRHPPDVDEVGDDLDAVPLPRLQLGPQVVGQVLGEDGDRVGPPVGEPLERLGTGDGPPARDDPRLDGDVREDVLDVEDEGRPAGPGHEPTGQAEGQRRRHGEHGVGPLPADEADQRGQHGEAPEGHGPGGDVGLVGRERVDPGDPTPVGGLGADQAPVPAVLDAVMAVPGQRGDDVQPVAPGDEVLGDAGHDLAGGGDVGREVGGDDGEVHEPESTSRYAASRASAEATALN